MIGQWLSKYDWGIVPLSYVRRQWNVCCAVYSVVCIEIVVTMYVYIDFFKNPHF